MHVYMDIRGRASKIYKAKTVIAVHQLSDFVIRGPNARYIATRSYGRNFYWSLFIGKHCFFKRLQTYQTFFVGWNYHHFGYGFQPRGLVAVMLHMRHKNDRP